MSKNKSSEPGGAPYLSYKALADHIKDVVKTVIKSEEEYKRFEESFPNIEKALSGHDTLELFCESVNDYMSVYGGDFLQDKNSPKPRFAPEDFGFDRPGLADKLEKIVESNNSEGLHCLLLQGLDPEEAFMCAVQANDKALAERAYDNVLRDRREQLLVQSLTHVTTDNIELVLGLVQGSSYQQHLLELAIESSQFIDNFLLLLTGMDERTLSSPRVRSLIQDVFSEIGQRQDLESFQAIYKIIPDDMKPQCANMAFQASVQGMLGVGSKDEHACDFLLQVLKENPDIDINYVVSRRSGKDIYLSALALAAHHGHDELMDELMKRGAALESRPEDSYLAVGPFWELAKRSVKMRDDEPLKDRMVEFASKGANICVVRDQVFYNISLHNDVVMAAFKYAVANFSKKPSAKRYFSQICSIYGNQMDLEDVWGVVMAAQESVDPVACGDRHWTCPLLDMMKKGSIDADSLLAYAMKNNRPDIAVMLCKRGVGPIAIENVEQALKSNNLELITAVVDRYMSEVQAGRQPDFGDDDVFSPLMMVIAKVMENKKTVKDVKEYIAGELSSYSGATMLHYAAELGNLPLIQRLKESGASVDKVNNQNDLSTVLHYALLSEDVDVVRACLSETNVNMADVTGVPPLDLVVGDINMSNLDQSFQLVRALVSGGADRSMYEAVTVSELLEEGVRMNENIQRALHKLDNMLREGQESNALNKLAEKKPREKPPTAFNKVRTACGVFSKLLGSSRA